jgi:DNA (cytosine-5)-methyltransferase 1
MSLQMTLDLTLSATSLPELAAGQERSGLQVSPTTSLVWTGSCPCQPFSTAGKGGGFADERHLWPAFLWHAQQCRPSVVFGEQVASADALRWWDVVATDLEDADYACAAIDLCAAGVGAVHIRQRLYWVAHSSSERRQQKSAGSLGNEAAHGAEGRNKLQQDGNNQLAGNGEGGSGMANTKSAECELSRNSWEWRTGFANDRVVEHANGERCEKQRFGFAAEPEQLGAQQSSFWDDAIWIPCADGKLRATQPGIRPLASGVSNRVGTLRGAGNAIVAPLASEFIKAVMKEIQS